MDVKKQYIKFIQSSLSKHESAYLYAKTKFMRSILIILSSY